MAVDLSLAAARAESDEKFREQFDKNSANHHGGLSQPVPVAKDIPAFGAGAFGGGAVPHSMKGPEVAEYVPPPAIDYGEEYDNIMKEREHLNKLKAVINKVTSSIGIMLTDLTNEKFKKDRDDAVEALKKFIPLLGEDNQWAKEVDTICKEAMGEAEDLAKKIHEMANTTNRGVFAYNKKMLARVKEIKKEAMAKAKAAKAEESKE
jgi:hypothetical protein